MLTRLKLKRGEGNIVVTSNQVRSRTRRACFPQYLGQFPPQVVVEASTSMSHEGEPKNMSKDENYLGNHSFI